MTKQIRNLPFTSHLKLLNSVHSKLLGHEQAEFNYWLNKARVKYAIEQLRTIEIIPTIYQKEQPDKLCTYYYPSKVYKKNANKKAFIQANLYDNFQSSNGIIIEGTVGQGKSILLRHLHISELNSGNSIPIFIELKDIKKDTTLSEFICKYISNTLKLRCSNELFEELLKNGVFSFFFDGFDELEYERRNIFVTSISYINNNNANLKTFVTSRPGNEIQSHSAFDIFSINPINGIEQINFVNKLLNKKYKKEQINYIKSNLESMDNNLRALLTTPLILTLFSMVYKNKIKIPDSYSAFYRTLFDTLVSEHDGLKLGFSRPTKSGLSADKIKTILEHLSFFSIQDEVIKFSIEEFIQTIKEVLIIVGEEKCNPKYVIEDLTKNTCLIQIDDMDYKFLHESIPNYFAASCIVNDASDEEAIEFYCGARQKWEKWVDVLEFLMNIDKRRFNPNFLIPEISSIFTKSRLPNEFILTLDAIREFSQNFAIGCYYSDTRKSQITPSSDYLLAVLFYPSTSWVFAKFFGFNGGRRNKVNIKNIISRLRQELQNTPAFKLSKFLLKNAEVSEYDHDCITSMRGNKIIEHFTLEKTFIEESRKLLLDPIKDAYLEANKNEDRLNNNKKRKVYGA